MRLATLLGPDLKDALTSNPAEIREALEDFHPEDIAEIIEDLPEKDALDLVRILPAEVGADVVERLSAERQELILQALDTDQVVDLLREMDPDDRADAFQELSDGVAETILAELERHEPEVAEEVKELAAWGPDTAGGLMTTEFFSLGPELKSWQAIDALREAAHKGDTELLYYVYVCGYGGKLLGVVSLRDLIVAEPSQALQDIMTEKVVRVAPNDDQEQVAAVIARYDLTAVPVVSEHDGVMLGIVTIDDVVDVVIEEATEDAQKMGAMVPLEDSYFATSLGEFVWKRAIWLVVLFLGQLLTATVMEANSDALQQTLVLAVFIPLIIASGGNAGSQSSTLIIRGLSVGEVAPRDWLRVLGREVGIGLALGIVLGTMGFLRVYLVGDTIGVAQIAVTVGLSILSTVTLSAVIGALLPMLIKRVGLDPAVSSTPFIASVVDVVGLLLYFALARTILSLAF